MARRVGLVCGEEGGVGVSRGLAQVGVCMGIE